MAAAFLLGACDQPQQAVAPPPPPPPPPPQNFMVFFDWDSTRLSDASLNVISQAATAFKSKGGARVTATGYTDTTGGDAYNMALSLRRANAVKDALVKEGVPPTAITVVGRGKTGLLVQTGDGVREPQNRRVEIAIAGMMSSAGYNEQAYCAAMSALYRRNVSQSNQDSIAGDGMAQCAAGNYSVGIPIMERVLTNARVPLPPKPPM
jgi:hypothetical protein